MIPDSPSPIFKGWQSCDITRDCVRHLSFLGLIQSDNPTHAMYLVFKGYVLYFSRYIVMRCTTELPKTILIWRTIGKQKLNTLVFPVSH